MIINGLSPGLAAQDQVFASLEEERISQEISLQKESAVKEAEKEEAQNEKKYSSKFVMDDYNLKELLFMMNSRGNSATIEKLAQLLKKEREMISKIK